MYNRYIPQPDGSYRKNRMPEPPRAQPQRPPAPKPQQPPEPPPCPPPQEQPPSPPPRSCPRQRPTPPSKSETSVTGFLRRLLPKDFDTGDLLIVLLLLLMAGDCHEDQNTALLTLALYFFM